jgi:ectoine hydroxylase-related dioxygenase (phytanoyl-CoA dioxygenase family)
LEVRKLDAVQQAGWDNDGFFIVRGLLPRDTVMELRGVVKNVLLTPEIGAEVGGDADPMDPMAGDSPTDRAARLRKLGRLGTTSPLLWSAFYAGAEVLALVRYFLGDDILVKFTSAFLKPARTGSATPWHQDNGLWRDGETAPFNLWMALDPATQENGCLQMVPGTQHSEIIPHVLYPDSIHGELPDERVRQKLTETPVRHIELEPGDAVCWHSSVWHYSPPNTSEKGRIGIAGVWSSLETAQTTTVFKNLHWAMREGLPVEAFPPQPFVAPGERASPPEWERRERRGV